MTVYTRLKLTQVATECGSIVTPEYLGQLLADPRQTTASDQLQSRRYIRRKRIILPGHGLASVLLKPPSFGSGVDRTTRANSKTP